MKPFLLLVAAIILGFLSLKNLRKAILHTFGSKQNNSSISDLNNDFENLIMNSFLQVREGMTLYLLHAFNNNLTKDEIDPTFENLISASPLSAKNQNRHLELLEVLIKNDRVADFFLEAMRIKTMLLSKIGHADEALEVRMNLLKNDLSISERSVTTDPMNPDEFIKEANIFLDECRKKYSGSLKLYNEYYQE